MINARRQSSIRIRRLTSGLAACLLLAALTGCVRREGLNTECQWPAEPPSPLDLSDAAHRRHLVADIEFAEELGIQHGDAFRGRETVPDRGRRADACTARLLQWIAVLHNVTPDAVEQLRGARSWRVDLVAVFAPMALLLCVLADRAGVRIRRRFTAPETTARIVAMLLASAVLAVAVVAMGELWSWGVEMARVGDGHLSYRAFRLPWTRHRLAIFMAGIAVSGIMMWRRGRPSDDDVNQSLPASVISP